MSAGNGCSASSFAARTSSSPKLFAASAQARCGNGGSLLCPFVSSCRGLERDSLVPSVPQEVQEPSLRWERSVDAWHVRMRRCGDGARDRAGRGVERVRHARQRGARSAGSADDREARVDPKAHAQAERRREGVSPFATVPAPASTRARPPLRARAAPPQRPPRRRACTAAGPCTRARRALASRFAPREPRGGGGAARGTPDPPPRPPPPARFPGAAPGLPRWPCRGAPPAHAPAHLDGRHKAARSQSAASPLPRGTAANRHATDPAPHAEGRARLSEGWVPVRARDR